MEPYISYKCQYIIITDPSWVNKYLEDELQPLTTLAIVRMKKHIPERSDLRADAQSRAAEMAHGYVQSSNILDDGALFEAMRCARVETYTQASERPRGYRRCDGCRYPTSVCETVRMDS
jgi:homoserine acetyltransferase